MALYRLVSGQWRRIFSPLSPPPDQGPSGLPPFFTQTPNNTGQVIYVGGTAAALTALDPENQGLTYSLTSGSLPPGLTLNGNGSFSGSPTVPGVFPITVTVTDSASLSSTTALTFTIQPVPVGTPGLLPIDPISDSALKAADPNKLSGAHLFHVQYTPAIAGSYTTDPGLTESLQYDLKFWLPPGALEGTVHHEQWGGTNRDRYYPRAARGAGFHVLDFRDEMKQMMAAGIDLGFVDVLTTDPTSQIGMRYRDLILAAEAEGFTLCAMPDGFSGIHDTGTQTGTGAQKIVDYLASTFWASSCALKVGGKIILAPYAPECVKSTLDGSVIDAAGGRAYWDSYITKAAAKGIQIDLWMCFQAAWDTRADCAPNYTSGTYADRYTVMSNWGGADPTDSGADTNKRRRAKAFAATLGKLFMQPVRPQDFRPDQAGAYEAGGFDQWDVCWDITISTDIPYIQYPTWNDLRESANIGLMVNCGWVWLDLARMNIQEWKTGVKPTIVRDALYGTHRIHHSSVTGAGKVRSALQTKFSIRKGSTAFRDQVQAKVFLTAPATVEIIVCGEVTRVDVEAGEQNVKAPLPAGKDGTVYFRCIRNGATVPGTEILSPFRVEAKPYVQDLMQRAVSSLRGPQLVPKMSRDPNPATPVTV